MNLQFYETFSYLVRTLGRPLDPFHDRSSSEAELVDNMEASAFPRYQVLGWTARIYMELVSFPRVTYPNTTALGTFPLLRNTLGLKSDIGRVYFHYTVLTKGGFL